MVLEMMPKQQTVSLEGLEKQTVEIKIESENRIHFIRNLILMQPSQICLIIKLWEATRSTWLFYRTTGKLPVETKGERK
jgi:hypothetical protein